MSQEGCGARGCRAGERPPVDLERRRTVVGLLIASGAAATLPGREAAAAAPDKAPPQVGDELVQAEGERKGQTVTAADLPGLGSFVPAWAKDASTGTVRSGSRLHRVLLVRLDPALLDGKTAARAAAGGIVAYSGFCTHAGCPIQHWKEAEQLIHCHCHGSEFNPRANGKVVGGPARRPLAGLPIKLEGERVIVAGEFAGKLGPPKA
jgi:Rieske Fe-S protein